MVDQNTLSLKLDWIGLLFKRPRFWMAPFVVGVSFSLGFEITNRVLFLQMQRSKATMELFSKSDFPGEDLDKIRLLYGDSADLLKVDLGDVKDNYYYMEKTKARSGIQIKPDNFNEMAKIAEESLPSPPQLKIPVDTSAITKPLRIPLNEEESIRDNNSAAHGANQSSLNMDSLIPPPPLADKDLLYKPRFSGFFDPLDSLAPPPTP